MFKAAAWSAKMEILNCTERLHPLSSLCQGEIIQQSDLHMKNVNQTNIIVAWIIGFDFNHSFGLNRVNRMKIHIESFQFFKKFSIFSLEAVIATIVTSDRIPKPTKRMLIWSTYLTVEYSATTISLSRCVAPGLALSTEVQLDVVWDQMQVDAVRNRMLISWLRWQGTYTSSLSQM